MSPHSLLRSPCTTSVCIGTYESNVPMQTGSPIGACTLFSPSRACHQGDAGRSKRSSSGSPSSAGSCRARCRGHTPPCPPCSSTRSRAPCRTGCTPDRTETGLCGERMTSHPRHPINRQCGENAQVEHLSKKASYNDKPHTHSNLIFERF